MASSRPRRAASETEPTRILYVDRDQVGDVAARAIERIGATPIEAVGGTDALKRVAVGAIDAVVLPGTLPDVSTTTVIERIASGESNVPVIVVGEAGPAGNPAITLPGDVSPAELADHLRRLTDRRRLSEPLGRYERLESAVLRIARAAVDVDDRTGIGDAVRDGLLETNRYRHVWVGTTPPDVADSPDGLPTPGGPIDALVEAADDSVLERAIEADEVVVADPEDVSESATTQGSGGGARLPVVVVPLAYGDSPEGLLVLTTAPDDEPDGPERELLTALGRIVGAILVAHRVGEPRASPGARSAGLVEAVAEELRDPLRIAAAALEGSEGPETERARDAIETMHGLLDAVVEVAGAGAIDELVETDVHELAARVWPSVRKSAAELRLGEPVTVDADPALLERVLATLLEGALENRGSDAVVKLGALSDGEGFSVEADEGTVADVREAFSEEDSRSTGDSRLARLRFAREVVEAHGWTVSVVEGETGGGRIEVRTGGGPEGSTGPDASR